MGSKKKIIKSFFSALFIAGIVSAVNAQTLPLKSGTTSAYTTQAVPLKFNLKQAITYGLENSAPVRSLKANFKANEWAYVSARGQRLPNLSLSGNVPGLQRRINTITLPDGSLAYVPQNWASSSLNLLLQQNITATGGNIFITTGLSRLDLLDPVPASVPADERVTYNANLMQVGFSQPLFKLNQLRWNWKQSALQYDFSKRQLAEAIEDYSITVTNAFYDLYIAGMQLVNAKYNASINDTLYNIAKGRFDVGKIAENDKLQAELNLMNAQNSVDQIRIRMQVAEKQLKILLGVPENQPVEVVAEDLMPIYEVQLEKAMAEARENRSDFINFKIQENDAEMAIRSAAADRRFSGDLNISYGLNQSAHDIGNVTRNPLESQLATITFSMPIVNFGRTKGVYYAAKSIKESRMAQIENTKNNLELQIMNNVLQFNQLKSILFISAKADTIARQRYEISTNRFLLGKIDLTNLTIAQNEKDQALINHIRNLQSFWVAYYQLRRLTLYDFEVNAKIIN